MNSDTSIQPPCGWRTMWPDRERTRSSQVSAHGDDQSRECFIAGRDADGPDDRPGSQALVVQRDIDLEGAALAARRAPDAEEVQIGCDGLDLELALAPLDQDRLGEKLEKGGSLRQLVQSHRAEVEGLGILIDIRLDEDVQGDRDSRA